MLEVTGVTLRRGGSLLLDGFSLRLPDPGTYLICGPAASGKSLLARLLCGRLRPARGNVILDGTPLYAAHGLRDALHAALRPQRVSGPLFHAAAGPPLLEGENLYEYLDVEMWRAGAPTISLLPYWEILEQSIFQARARTLGSLASGELSLAQLALGAAIPARVVVLDGQLALLDGPLFKAAQRLLAVTHSLDRFVVLTAPPQAGELGRTTRIELTGKLPVGVVAEAGTDGER